MSTEHEPSEFDERGDELDQILRQLRVEQVQKRPPKWALEPLTEAQQRANFLALARGIGGLTRLDKAYLKARAHQNHDEGEPDGT